MVHSWNSGAQAWSSGNYPELGTLLPKVFSVQHYNELGAVYHSIDGRWVLYYETECDSDPTTGDWVITKLPSGGIPRFNPDSASDQGIDDSEGSSFYHQCTTAKQATQTTPIQGPKIGTSTWQLCYGTGCSANPTYYALNLYYGDLNFPVTGYDSLYLGTRPDAIPCVSSTRTDMDGHLFRFYVFGGYSTDGSPYWMTPDATGMTKYYLQYQIGCQSWAIASSLLQTTDCGCTTHGCTSGPKTARAYGSVSRVSAHFEANTATMGWRSACSGSLLDTSLFDYAVNAMQEMPLWDFAGQGHLPQFYVKTPNDQGLNHCESEIGSRLGLRGFAATEGYYTRHGYTLNGAPVYRCCGCSVVGEPYYTYLVYDAAVTNWAFVRKSHAQMLPYLYTGGSSTAPSSSTVDANSDFVAYIRNDVGLYSQNSAARNYATVPFGTWKWRTQCSSSPGEAGQLTDELEILPGRGGMEFCGTDPNAVPPSPPPPSPPPPWLPDVRDCYPNC